MDRASGAMPDFPGVSLAVGDFNGDGKDDLVGIAVTSQSTLGLGIYLNGTNQYSKGYDNSTFSFTTGFLNDEITGIAIGDVNGDGCDDVVYQVNEGISGPYQTYLKLQRTDSADANFVDPAHRWYVDPEVPIQEIANGLFEIVVDDTPDDTPDDVPDDEPAEVEIDGVEVLVEQLGPKLVTAGTEELLRKIVGGDNTRGDASRYHAIVADVFDPPLFREVVSNGRDRVFELELDYVGPGTGESVFIEIQFTRTSDGTFDADGFFTQDELWTPVRLTVLMPAHKLGTAGESIGVALANMGGNSLFDLIDANAWNELIPPTGLAFPWEFDVAKRQSLPGTSGIWRAVKQPVLERIGATWMLIYVSDPDVLVRTFDGTAFSEAVPLSLGGVRAREFAVGDVDGDSVADIAVASGSGSAPGGSNWLVSLVRGQSNGTFLPAEVLGSLRGAAGDLAIADVNQDGQNEVVTIDQYPFDGSFNPQGRVAWFSNVGSGAASLNYFNRDFYTPHAIVVGNFGGGPRNPIALQTRKHSGISGQEAVLYLLRYSEPEPVPVGVQWEAAGRANGSVATAPDGRVGMLVAESNSRTIPAPNGDERKRLLYVEILPSGDPATPEQVVCFPPDFGRNFESAVLFFGPDSVPEVFTLNEGHVMRWVRNGSAWLQAETVSAPAGLFPGADGSFLTSLAAAKADDGSTHFALYAETFPFGGTEMCRVLHLRRSAAGTWTWAVAAAEVTDLNTLDAFEYVEVRQLDEPRNLSIAVDPSGFAHIVFSWGREITPISGGSNVRSSLFYLTNKSGNWMSETILGPGGEFGDAGLGASVAAATNGIVAIAASWIPRASTGSPGSAELRYFVKEGGSDLWASSIIASASDNFVAGSGPRGTGLFPRLVFDEDSSPHVVFADHAAQGFGEAGSKSFSGQIRYATRPLANSGAWSIETPLSRGNFATIDFQTYDIDLAVGSDQVFLSATNFIWRNAQLAYFKQHVYGPPGALRSSELILPPAPDDGVGETPATPNLRPVKAKIKSLKKRLVQVRRKVSDPSVRAAQVKKLRVKIRRLERRLK